MFKEIKMKAAASRRNEELLYERVAEELRSGNRKDGLWLKALEQSVGSEEIAKTKYIRLRVQSLKDDMELHRNDVSEIKKQNAPKEDRTSARQARCMEKPNEPSYEGMSQDEKEACIAESMLIEIGYNVARTETGWVVTNKKGRGRKHFKTGDQLLRYSTIKRGPV